MRALPRLRLLHTGELGVVAVSVLYPGPDPSVLSQYYSGNCRLDFRKQYLVVGGQGKFSPGARMFGGHGFPRSNEDPVPCDEPYS